MICKSCGHEPPAGSMFCNGCGVKLPLVCASCGATPPPGSRFCNGCGSPLDAAGAVSPPIQGARSVPPPSARGLTETRTRPALNAPTEARKIISIVFADLMGSTGLQEQLDPESVNRVMDAYYETVRRAVESAGGTVVQLLGDGVLCAFGIPRIAEDDALRAVRAAMGMQDGFREFLRAQRQLSVPIGLRVAVNTGEVVVSEEHPAGIGDPLNVAARLQQEARDGEVLIGQSTRHLVADTVTLERAGVFKLKGRTETVTAWRVLSLQRPTGTTAAFVGRNDELARLTVVYDEAVNACAARLAVLVGSPGLGKSRLIDELARRLGDQASVVAAHCDASGGATFAPIANAISEWLGAGATGDDASAPAGLSDELQAAIEAALPTGDADRARIARGVVDLLRGVPPSPEETFFVIRRFFSALAQRRPLVLVIDDLHWAEPLLLDLVEHLIQWASEAPLFVLVGARPELRERRSSLVTSGGLVSAVVTLAGLDAGAAMQLAANVIGAADLPAAVAARVLASSEGNPLFVGELVRMLVDEGALTRDGERWIVGENLAELSMPPTIHALLAARLDRLRPDQRTVLERASVVGRQFSRGALTALLRGEGAAGELLGLDGTALDAALEALRRSELIEPDAGWFLGEPMLRFHHALIRDAAYRRLLKGTRAELHQRLADWIEAQAPDNPEHDETVGRHLEQAHMLLGEIAPLDEQGRSLGERAARRLASAGRRALARDDLSMASDLLGRAVARLEPDDPGRADLTLDWCEALLSAGDVGPAAAVIATLDGLKDRRHVAWKTCFAGQLSVLTSPEKLQAAADAVADAATTFVELGDAAGEAKAHFVRAQALSRLGKVGACESALDLALAAARNAGDRRRANTVLAIAPLAALWGPSPVTRASGRCLDVVRVLRITQGAPAVEAVALSCQGVLEALRGRADAAQRMIAAARKTVAELGVAQRLFEIDVSGGFVALLEGDAPTAERTLRAAYEGLRGLGLGIDAARAAALLARAVLAQGRIDEALELSFTSEALAGDDLKAAIAWRGVRAEALAMRGEPALAIEFARAAVDIATSTDALLDHADARLALAAALRAAGEQTQAAAQDLRAVELWEAKGATLLVQRARGRHTDLEEQNKSVGPAGARAMTAASPGRHVPENAATRLCTVFASAIAARDVEMLLGLLADDFEFEDRPTGTRYGRREFETTWRSILAAEHIDYEPQILGSLGESIALYRHVFVVDGFRGSTFRDAGRSEYDDIAVVEADTGGKCKRMEVFGAARLGEAVACIYERHALGFPPGSERDRSMACARVFRAHEGPIVPERIRAALDPAHRCVDHRVFGTWNTQNADELVNHYRAKLELAPDFSGRVEDVLALDPQSALLLMCLFGVGRDSGGAFENRLLVLFTFGPDGCATSFECFEPEQGTAAIARFTALVGHVTPAAGHEAVTEQSGKPRSLPANRRVRASSESRWYQDAVQAIQVRDVAALRGLIADGFHCEHRPTGASYGKREFMGTWRGILTAAHMTYVPTLIASLGDRVVLHRHLLTVDGLRDPAFADSGLIELDEVVVMEAGEDGLLQRMELFVAAKLGEAVACAYERFATHLPAGRERERALGIARFVLAQTGQLDTERLVAAISPDFRCVDRRVFGTWSMSGTAEVAGHYRQQLALTKDFSGRIDAVLALDAGALLVSITYDGMGRDSAGTFENQMLLLVSAGPDGPVDYIELIESDREADALAHLEARVSSAAHSASARRFTNAATRAVERGTAALAARDWDAFAALMAPGFRHFDRTRIAQLESDGQAWLASFRRMVEMTSAPPVYEVLATRGERLALMAMVWRGADADIGESEIEWRLIIEVNASGEHVAIVSYDAGDVDAAYAELDARFDMSDEVLQSATWRSMRHFTASVARHDWDAIATLCADTFVEFDHRSLATLGTTHGGVAWARNFSELVTLAPDTVYRVHHFIDRDFAYYSHGSWVGTREGGAYELVVNAVLELDKRGLILRADIYDGDSADEALERLERLAAAVARQPSTKGLSAVGSRIRNVAPNAAHAALARMVAAYRTGAATGSWAEMREVCAAEYAFADHRRMNLLEGGLEMLIAAFQERAASGARLSLTPIGSAGDRVAVTRLLVSGGPADGPFEIEYQVVAECDQAGRLCASVNFEPDDARAAQREAWRWWASIEPEIAGIIGLVDQLIDVFNTQDRQAFRALCADDLRYHDERRTGVGLIEGADSAIESIEVYWWLAGTQRIELGREWPAYGPYAALTVVRRFGTLPDGGEFESEYLEVFGVRDGRVTHLQLFELDDLARAVARTAELNAVLNAVIDA